MHQNLRDFPNISLAELESAIVAKRHLVSTYRLNHRKCFIIVALQSSSDSL